MTLVDRPGKYKGQIQHWMAEIQRLRSLVGKGKSEEERQTFEDMIVRLRAKIDETMEGLVN